MSANTGQNNYALDALIALLVIALSFSIFNQSNKNKNTPSEQSQRIAKPALQIGAYVGGADTKGWPLVITKSDDERTIINDIVWQGENFKAPIYYGIRTIYRRPFLKHIGYMTDFTHIKAVAPPSGTVTFIYEKGKEQKRVTEPLNKTIKKLQFSHGHNLLTINGILSLPVFYGWIKPYIGIGAGGVLPHVEFQRYSDPRNLWTSEYQFTGPVIQGQIGIEIKITERFSWFFEYKLNYANIDATLKTGERIQTQLYTHQGVSGLLGDIIR